MEDWKPVQGFEEKYLISNLGNVMSLKYKKQDLHKLLTPTKCSRTGYMRVKLTQYCKSKTETIHRLVAVHFIPNPENKATVNHINGIKTDNRI